VVVAAESAARGRARSAQGCLALFFLLVVSSQTNRFEGKAFNSPLILEIRQVHEFPGHVLFPFRFPMHFQIFNLAAAEMAQLFCNSILEFF
jgi:hypothetical protein